MAQRLSNSKNPAYPRNKPCGHGLHPGITGYTRPKCPSCRINLAMFDVRQQQDRIISKGGIEEWREMCSSEEEACDWVRTCKGPSPSNDYCKPSINIYGDNTSFRSAKVRLLNLLIELDEHAAMEVAWELQHSALESTQQTRVKYSAREALDLYEAVVNQGVITKVEKKSASIGIKRGREWQAIVDLGFPAGEEFDYSGGKKGPYRQGNAAQREFIDAYPKKDESAAEPPSKRKRRDTGTKVSFNEVTYVRSESEIDNLRFEYRDELASPKGRSALMTPRPSILRTVPMKKDSRPSRPHYLRPLRDYDGGHSSNYYSRREETYYRPNDWTEPLECDWVDTNGMRYLWGSWEQRLDLLLGQGDTLDDFLMDVSQEEASLWSLAEEQVRVIADLRADGVSDEEIRDAGMIDEELKEEEEQTTPEQPDPASLEKEAPVERPSVKVEGLRMAVRQFPRARLG